MALRAFLFDMDHTLIDNDCDVSWKTFLVEHRLAPPDALEMAESFYRQYLKNELDIAEFMRFQLAEFANHTVAEMAALAQQHFNEKVADRLFDDAKSEIALALEQGAAVAIVTSTNRVVAEPVAAALGISQLLATEPEIRNGLYTGDMTGVYCGGTGKVSTAKQFCRQLGIALTETAYYGDSLADLPLLEAASVPSVVNPVPELAEIANLRGWRILNWK